MGNEKNSLTSIDDVTRHATGWDFLQLILNSCTRTRGRVLDFITWDKKLKIKYRPRGHTRNPTPTVDK